MGVSFSILLLFIVIFQVFVNRKINLLKTPHIEDIFDVLLYSLFKPEIRPFMRLGLFIPEYSKRFIFFKSKKNPKLRMKYHFNMRQNDRLLVFDENQGGVGRAFTEKSFVVIDLTDQGHEDFGLTKEQINLVWIKLKTIFCFPILSSNSLEVKAVLVIDSSLTISDLDLEYPKSIDLNDLILHYISIIEKII